MPIETGAAMIIASFISAGAQMMMQPDAPPPPPAPVPEIQDKQTPEADETLEELQIGDESSTRRKQLGTKSRFKETRTTSESGTAITGTGSGVQI